MTEAGKVTEDVPAVTKEAEATAEGAAESGKAGFAGYFEKAKDAARGYLDKHPPPEEPRTGLSGYLDKAKSAAKGYLNKPAEGTGESKSDEGIFGLGALVEKALGLFKTHEGREADATDDEDVKKLSDYIKKYLHVDVSPATLKTHLASLKAALHVGGAAPTADTPAPAAAT